MSSEGKPRPALEAPADGPCQHILSKTPSDEGDTVQGPSGDQFDSSREASCSPSRIRRTLCASPARAAVPGSNPPRACRPVLHTPAGEATAGLPESRRRQAVAARTVARHKPVQVCVLPAKCCLQDLMYLTQSQGDPGLESRPSLRLAVNQLHAKVQNGVLSSPYRHQVCPGHQFWRPHCPTTKSR